MVIAPASTPDAAPGDSEAAPAVGMAARAASGPGF
jgi:hypothetical protein